MHAHKSARLLHEKEQLDNKYVHVSCYPDMKRYLYTHVHKFEIDSEFFAEVDLRVSFILMLTCYPLIY
jgi:hypothetical protein